MEQYTFDLQRIFLGDSISLLYLVEIVFRTLVLFFFTLFMLRFIGTRGLGQITLFELALIIALGSAVGDPMFYPDVPLLHGMTAITLVIFFQRLIVGLTNRDTKIENFIEGQPIRLVVDGHLDLEGLKQSLLSTREIFMELRIRGCDNLGAVRRAYLEIDGEVSIFFFEADRDQHYGLPLIPPPQNVVISLFKAGTACPEAGHFACTYCGAVSSFIANQSLPPCPRCGHPYWLKATKSSKKHALMQEF